MYGNVWCLYRKFSCVCRGRFNRKPTAEKIQRVALIIDELKDREVSQSFCTTCTSSKLVSIDHKMNLSENDMCLSKFFDRNQMFKKSYSIKHKKNGILRWGDGNDNCSEIQNLNHYWKYLITA